MQPTVESRAWRVFGVIVLAAIAAAAAWYFTPWSDTTYELRTQDTVSGLIPGAPVEFHGVEVGKVRDVRLLNARTVQVLVRLRRDAPVSTATVATITGRGLASRGFTGYVYVSLEDIAPTGTTIPVRPEESYARIATAPSRVDSIDTSVTQLNENVRTMTALLQNTLDASNIAALKATVAHLEQVSGTLAANDGRLRTIIANMDRASSRMPALVRSGGAAMQTLQSNVLPQAQATLSHYDAVAGTASGVLQRADAASQGLGPLVQSGNAVMESVQTQVLPQTRLGLARMNDVLVKLDDTAGRVRDDPSVLIRGSSASTVPDPGETR